MAGQQHNSPGQDSRSTPDANNPHVPWAKPCEMPAALSILGKLPQTEKFVRTALSDLSCWNPAKLLRSLPWLWPRFPWGSHSRTLEADHAMHDQEVPPADGVTHTPREGCRFNYKCCSADMAARRVLSHAWTTQSEDTYERTLHWAVSSTFLPGWGTRNTARLKKMHFTPLLLSGSFIHW